ncbi:MAG TPA: ABC transporter permease subunit [Gemmataceae bacterium]|nr:ABC transporter permease subunit [Gemmataceae bacterium]
MTGVLVRKLLRDVRLTLLVASLLLGAFQCLWAKITQRVMGEIAPFFNAMAAAQSLSQADLEAVLFSGPGKIVRAVIGENIAMDRAMNMLSIGYVHPLVVLILCIWAVGRAAGAIAGEIDRGTMELLLSQPLARSRVVLAHLAVDLLTIPVLCLSMWAGNWLGAWLVGPIQVVVPDNPNLPPLLRRMMEQPVDPERLRVDPAAFGPALFLVGALVFAVSGYTMWLSARGRFRWRVLGVAVFLTLVQFLINLIGQLWEEAFGWLRPFTVFFYYQPQQVVLKGQWMVDLGTAWNGGQPLLAVNGVAVLLAVGVVGYTMALLTFRRRDLPAPL